MAEGRAPRARCPARPGRHGPHRAPGHRGPAAGRLLSGLLVLFLDGVGIGPDDPDVNPFLRAELPTLAALLGGRLPTLDEPTVGVDGTSATGRSAVAFPLDATLGVEGLPQSGTGQATLLTGENAAVLHGGHFGPWVPVRLRPLVENRSLLRRARAAGVPTAFANAYPRNWPGEGRSGRRVAGPPLAARAAGLLTRDHTALATGEAVASEIVNDGWRRWIGDAAVPSVTAHEAGGVLARIAVRHTLSLYAHYATDTAGHRGGMDGAVAALERVDAFMGGLLAHLPRDRHVLLVSDHGNIEDVRGGHTRNPAFGLLAGPDAPERARALGSLEDVTPASLRWLGIDPEEAIDEGMPIEEATRTDGGGSPR